MSNVDHRKDGPSPAMVAAGSIVPEAHTGSTDTVLAAGHGNVAHSNKVRTGSARIYTCDNKDIDDMKALIFHNDHNRDGH
jgi:hypothetical protein